MRKRLPLLVTGYSGNVLLSEANRKSEEIGGMWATHVFSKRRLYTTQQWQTENFGLKLLQHLV